MDECVDVVPALRYSVRWLVAIPQRVTVIVNSKFIKEMQQTCAKKRAQNTSKLQVKHTSLQMTACTICSYTVLKYMIGYCTRNIVKP